jgi:hypothetical protein
MRNSIIYVQDKHSVVFDLTYQFDVNRYQGDNLTILVPHLIDGKTIVAWAYQKVPEPIVWCVMSDGTMIAMTYEKDNRIFGWHTHNSPGASGTIKDVIVIPEGAEEAVYVVTKRNIDGTDRQFIERMWNRQFTDVRDCKFLDSYLTMDSPLPITNISTLGQVTSPSHGFDEDDIVEIDEVVGTTELNLNKYRVAEKDGIDFYLVEQHPSDDMNITSVNWSGPVCTVVYDNTNITIVSGAAVFIQNTGNAAIDDLWHVVGTAGAGTFILLDFAGANREGSGTESSGLIRTATRIKSLTTYISDGVVRLCKTSITGLDVLEGEAVEALCDGDWVDGLTVSSGAVTIPDASARVCVGFPYVSQTTSLPLDTPRGELLERVRSIKDVELKLYNSRGVKAGPIDEVLHEQDYRTDEGWNETTRLFSGETTIEFEPERENVGKYVIQQSYPLPMTVQAVGINVTIGDSG